MDIRSVALGSGPIPSFVVLEQHDSGARKEDVSAAASSAAASVTSGPGAETPPERPSGRSRRVPIRIGTVEAAAISSGVHSARGAHTKKEHRPRTHDLLKATIEALGAQLLSVRITEVSGTTFYAQLVLRAADGTETCVDARPSDAIALAVRCGVNVLATDEVIESASLFDFEGVREAEQAIEAAEFHEFVEGLSPEDFAEGGPSEGRPAQEGPDAE